MKKTLLGICRNCGVGSLAALVVAASAHAGAVRLDVPLQAPAARWSASVMERHAPLDSAQLQKLSQKKFRYMDMAQGKRSTSIRNAVIIRGPAQARQSSEPAERAQPNTYRKNAQPGHPGVIMRPMT